MITVSKSHYDKLPVRFMGGIPPILIEEFARANNLSTDYAYFLNFQNGVYLAIKNGIYKAPLQKGLVTKFEAKELGESVNGPEHETGMSMGGIKGPSVGMTGPSL